MSDERRPLRGDVWDAYLDPVVGHEQGGRRPVIVVSNDGLNTSGSDLSWIVPLTSRNRNVWAHPSLPTGEGGLDDESYILCDQLRVLSHQRFKRYRGRVSSETLTAIASIVAIMLADD